MGGADIHDWLTRNGYAAAYREYSATSSPPDLWREKPRPASGQGISASLRSGEKARLPGEAPIKAMRDGRIASR